MEPIEMLKHLSPEHQQQYMNLERTLESPGWEALHADLSEKLGSVHAVVANAASWDEYKYAQGFRDALLLLVNAQERIEAEFTALAEERSEAAEESEEEPPLDFM